MEDQFNCLSRTETRRIDRKVPSGGIVDILLKVASHKVMSGMIQIEDLLPRRILIDSSQFREAAHPIAQGRNQPDANPLVGWKNQIRTSPQEY